MQVKQFTEEQGQFQQYGIWDAAARKGKGEYLRNAHGYLYVFKTAEEAEAFLARVPVAKAGK